MAQESEFDTVEDLCAKLKITRTTLWTWRRKGLFTPTPYKVGRRKVLFKTAEVSEWLETHRDQVAS